MYDIGTGFWYFECPVCGFASPVFPSRGAVEAYTTQAGHSCSQCGR